MSNLTNFPILIRPTIFRSPIMVLPLTGLTYIFLHPTAFPIFKNPIVCCILVIICFQNFILSIGQKIKVDENGITYFSNHWTSNNINWNEIKKIDAYLISGRFYILNLLKEQNNKNAIVKIQTSIFNRTDIQIFLDILDEKATLSEKTKSFEDYRHMNRTYLIPK